MPDDEFAGEIPPEATADLLRLGLREKDHDCEESGMENSEPPHRTTLAPGAVIQGLEILEEVGRGGMGIVYRARQLKLEKIVALKVLRPEIAADPSAGKRLREEAERVANFKHDHIVTVYDIDDEDPPHFFSMEFIEGRSLAEKIDQEGFLEPKEAVDLLAPICEALDYAHGKGVFHGDVKPSNILRVNGIKRAMLTDFGIARLRSDFVQMERDGNPSVGGTPGFVAPEQAQEGIMNERTDVYSMGMTLYYALTGELPRPVGPNPSLAFLFRNKEFHPPSALSGSANKRLDAVVLKMIAADPGDRYPTCQAAAKYLRSTVNRTAPGRFLPVTVIAALLLCTLALGWAWVGSRPVAPVETPPRNPPVAATRVPFRVKTAGAFVTVLDQKGDVIYSVRVRGSAVKYILTPLVSGQAQYLVVAVQGPGKDTGKVMVYDPKGERVWAKPTYAADEPCPYPGAASNRMTISGLVVADLWQNGEPCIVTTSNDLDTYQTKVTVFDKHGARKATYWHPGQFQKIKVFKPSQGDRMWILAWGINNDMAAARRESKGEDHYRGIACLDPQAMSGEGPPRRGFFGRGNELWYTLILPRGTAVQNVRIRPPKPGAPEGARGQLLRVLTSKGVFLFLDERGKLLRRMFTDGVNDDEGVTAKLVN